MELWQALLISAWVVIAICDDQTFQFHISRPLVTGPIIGFILGDLHTGLLVGGTVELMFLAVIFVGTAVPPNHTIAVTLGTVLAVSSGGNIQIAIAAALPVALIGQMMDTLQNAVINVYYLHRVDAAVYRNDMRGVVRNNLVFPLLTNVLLWGVPVFIAVYLGTQNVLDLMKMVPEKVIEGLAVGGGLIGAVGFALLLRSIKAKNVWPMFLIGFVLSSYFKLNLIGISVLAFALIILQLQKMRKEDLQKKHAGGN
ncbi:MULTISPECIES: PTS mannose/fructose/sorbose/N-acetylgalactosamine transporter subunit IIC [Klebsiella]|uniref:PTS sugar transporter subunit IIC n=2 Tax=Klebsiella pneumoniae TaxID=573 RepID=A0A6B2I0B8_KLEPN|nr:MULTISPECIES: PTS sugar transporter subunit IIC [Klebsiella]EKH6437597.1 PTS sugar transporter subunit IIC [Klebsiella oxytoca]HBX3543959.1 PTS sugar transporter subunit IIC [Klebsiella pneumoniae subsp. pneumoniae]EIV5818078.1 PTS sugar transporter subunit IIC [Klebsiella pneumoniae]EKJ7590135.1 PTS sugar transporter subunit IIC [Klebsiella oxytoca]EKT8694403.1 PTS sugar transporter subunit IIC [Klebsiella pneumoniae]